MGVHDHILRVLNESKKPEVKNRIKEAVAKLKEVCPDLEPQERYDLMSVIFDIEDINARSTPE